MAQISRPHSALVSRPAEYGPADCEPIGRLLLGMYQEIGRGRLNPQKAWLQIVTTVRDHAAYVVHDGDELVASAGLVPIDLCYTDDPFFTDQWFYVSPDYRGGRAFRLLLGEIQTFSDMTEASVLVRVFNERRAKVRDGVSRVGETFAISPAGADLVVSPRGTAPHVR